MHLTIRVDGGPEIGFGHLIRSNALAEEFLSRNHDVTVATTTPQPVQTVFPDAVTIAELSSRSDPLPFVDWLESNAPDVVFTDAYPADTDYQRAIRDRVPLAVLQDDDRHAVAADLFINGNLYAPDLDYEFVDTEPKTCLGTEYVLLRREVRERAGAEPPWREQPERAIIMMGGSDVANLMPTIIRSFEGIDIHVDAIVGPGFSHEQKLAARAIAREVSAQVSVTHDPDDLVQRMFEADFAISSSGSTTYELMALGTPIISLPVVENQEPLARSLKEHNAAIVVNQIGQRPNLESTIRQIISSPIRREGLLYKGQNLIQIHGIDKLVPEIYSLTQ